MRGGRFVTRQHASPPRISAFDVRESLGRTPGGGVADAECDDDVPHSRSTRLLQAAARSMKKRRCPLVPPPLRSLRHARRVTSAFHARTRDLEARPSSPEPVGAPAAASHTPAASRRRRRGGTQEARERGDAAAAQRTAAELEALGGRDAYQAASVLTTARHRTAKYVFASLTALGLRPAAGQPPLRTLEVGAVNLDLQSVRWLAVRAIDLHAQHPRIEQRDFFLLPQRGEFAVVVCAMVLNCVAAERGPRAAGAMLAGLRRHLAPGGVAFVVLPRRCLAGDGAGADGLLSPAQFRAAMKLVGLRVVHARKSPRLLFYCARAARPASAAAAEAAFPDTPRQRQRPPGGASPPFSLSLVGAMPADAGAGRDATAASAAGVAAAAAGWRGAASGDDGGREQQPAAGARGQSRGGSRGARRGRTS